MKFVRLESREVLLEAIAQREDAYGGLAGIQQEAVGRLAETLHHRLDRARGRAR